MLKITSDSHTDHALTQDHLDFIVSAFADKDAFFITTLELPKSLPGLPCAIYGPIMGDSPIKDEDVSMEVRGSREEPSRMIAKEPRSSRLLTVIAGPHNDEDCILYTAYGGPCAPKEPFSCEEGSEERKKSEEFWSEHALASLEQTKIGVAMNYTNLTPHSITLRLPDGADVIIPASGTVARVTALPREADVIAGCPVPVIPSPVFGEVEGLPFPTRGVFLPCIWSGLSSRPRAL